MQKNQGMSGSTSLVGGLGQHEDKGSLVLGVMECGSENAMSTKGRKSSHLLPSFLLCSQSILLKVKLESCIALITAVASHYMGMKTDTLTLTPVHISQSCYRRL